MKGEKYRPVSLVATIVAILVGFALFFEAFLLAPLAILALFYFALSASDRGKRRRDAALRPPPST